MLSVLARHCRPPEYALPCFHSRYPHPVQKPATLCQIYQKPAFTVSLAPSAAFSLGQLHHTTNTHTPHQAFVQFFPCTNV